MKHSMMNMKEEVRDSTDGDGLVWAEWQHLLLLP